MTTIPLRYDPRRDVCPIGIGQDRDLTSHEGNIKLAEELNHWWAQRGYGQVKWEAVPRPGSRNPSTDVAWTVRSNLINGLPPKAVG